MRKILSFALIFTMLFSMLTFSNIAAAEETDVLVLEEDFTSSPYPFELGSENPSATLPFSPMSSGNWKWQILSADDKNVPAGASGNVAKIYGGTTGQLAYVFAPANVYNAGTVTLEIKYYISSAANSQIIFKGDANGAFFTVKTTGKVNTYNNSNSNSDKNYIMKTGWHQLKIVFAKGSTNFNNVTYYEYVDGEYVQVATGYRAAPTYIDTVAFNPGSGSETYVDYFKIYTTEPKTVTDKLTALETPEWNDTAINWAPVSGEEPAKYAVKIYKDDVASKTLYVAPTDTSLELQQYLKAMGPGNYRVTITAIGKLAVILDSEESALSEVLMLVPEPLSKPEAPNFVGQTIEFESNSNAVSSNVKLYKDNALIKTYENAISPLNIRTDIIKAGDGIYTATITNIGDGVSASDSEESDKSAAYDFKLDNYKAIKQYYDFDNPDYQNEAIKSQTEINADFPKFDGGKALYYKSDVDQTVPFGLTSVDAPAIEVSLDVAVVGELASGKGFSFTLDESGTSVAAQFGLKYDNAEKVLKASYYQGNSAKEFNPACKLDLNEEYNIKIRLTKENNNEYSFAEYFVDGEKLTTLEGATIRNATRSSIGSMRLNISSSNVVINNITVCEYFTESNSPLAAVANAKFENKSVKFDAVENAQYYTAALYNDSVKIAEKSSKDTEIDFSEFISENQLYNVSVYTVSVKAVGDLTNYGFSEEVQADGSYTCGVVKREDAVIVNNQTELCVTQKVSKISEEQSAPYMILLAIYENDGMVRCLFATADWSVQEQELVIETDALTKGQSAKLFFWTGFENLVPVQNAIDISYIE